MPKITPDQLPFSEAIDFFKSKTLLPTESWTDIYQEHHSHAAVVAGANTDALVGDIINAVAKAKWAGGGYDEFKAAFPEIAKKHGWAYNGSPGWRSRIIYDTNITQAYNAGRYKQMVAIKHLMPYWKYVHTSIEHPRLQHKAWNGLILSVDDPWWDTHSPQNGWRCKCRVDPMTRLTASREWEKKGKSGPDEAPPIEWEEKTIGKNGPSPRTVMVPKGIDPGFAYNPGKAWLEPHVVPPLPEKLAKLVPDEWPRPKGYKPPPTTAATPFLNHVLIDQAIPAKQAVSDWLAIFGATLSEPSVLIADGRPPLVIGARMFIQSGAPYDPALGDEQFKMILEGKQGRKKYLNLLAMSVLDPDEIWESWETIKKGTQAGSKFLVRHYLKLFVTTDENGKERYMMSVFRKSNDGWSWDGVTTFNSSRDSQFQKMRRGYLYYKK
jgi:hypothetical protein